MAALHGGHHGERRGKPLAGPDVWRKLLAGIGAGIVLPSIYALATTIAPRVAEAVLGRVLAGWSVSLVAGVPASALISDLAGWRASFLALAVLAAFSLLGSLRLPEGCRPHASVRQGLLEPLGYPTVRPLLLVCLAFMAAFYGVYAFLGDTLRVATGATAAGAGMAVLTYGIGFGLASLADRRVDRWGAERVLPWSLAAVALIYLALVPATRAIWSTALLTAVWGGANHLCLNALIVLLARAQPDRRGAVLGLNSAVTYLGALLGTGAAGLAYQRAGFMALGIGAAALLAVAALVAQFGGAGARQTYDAAATPGAPAAPFAACNPGGVHEQGAPLPAGGRLDRRPGYRHVRLRGLRP